MGRKSASTQSVRCLISSVSIKIAQRLCPSGLALQGIYFLRGVPEDVVEEIGVGRKVGGDELIGFGLVIPWEGVPLAGTSKTLANT